MGETAFFAVLILGGFLLGSVLFSKWVSSVLCGVDICENSPDHNPGATNVFLSCGVSMGVLALVLDLLKGFLPVFAACRYGDVKNTLFALVMLAPVLGHAIGIYDHFHGGKCIATSFGVEIALLGETGVAWVLAGLYILFSTLVKISPNRIRSIVTYSLFGVIASLIALSEHQDAIALGNVLISLTVVAKHLRPVPEELPAA